MSRMRCFPIRVVATTLTAGFISLTVGCYSPFGYPYRGPASGQPYGPYGYTAPQAPGSSSYGRPAATYGSSPWAIPPTSSPNAIVPTTPGVPATQAPPRLPGTMYGQPYGTAPARGALPTITGTPGSALPTTTLPSTALPPTGPPSTTVPPLLPPPGLSGNTASPQAPPNYGTTTAPPNWFAPGTLQKQQVQASVYDPYAAPGLGPEIVGGRPTGYQQPYSLPYAAPKLRGFRDTRWPF